MESPGKYTPAEPSTISGKKQPCKASVTDERRPKNAFFPEANPPRGPRERGGAGEEGGECAVDSDDEFVRFDVAQRRFNGKLNATIERLRAEAEADL